MPARLTPLVTGQIYHVFNRGNEKRKIFLQRNDFKRFLKSLRYYQIEGRKPSFSKFSEFYHLDPTKKIVDILAYCLMPNHFHIIIKQQKERGITESIGKLSNSYTKYFNIKNDRVGSLFQGQFKAVLIESDEQLLHLSRYIHLNPIASFLTESLRGYEWSSYQEYISNSHGICSKDIILGQFSSKASYENFVLDQVEYGQTLELIKHQLIE